jgi:phosphoribosylanthranilate isomerase
MHDVDVQMCVRYGADIVGFVVDFPHPVPWNLSVQSAKEIVSKVSKPTETCIVTGGAPDKVLKLIIEIQPDYVQLHCGETLTDTIRLVGELGKRRVKIIKAVFPDTPNLERTAVDFCAAGVHALLFDPRTPNNAISSGAADISAFIKLQRVVNCPVIIAGGITPGNVKDIILRTGARIIDLMTGVEHSPGVKDEVKVASLSKVLQSINDHTTHK